MAIDRTGLNVKVIGQGQGHGSVQPRWRAVFLLCLYLMDYVFARNTDLLWLNAKTDRTGFWCRDSDISGVQNFQNI